MKEFAEYTKADAEVTLKMMQLYAEHDARERAKRRRRRITLGLLVLGYLLAVSAWFTWGTP